MMVCNKCDYVVDGSLKFVVANNVCPKCGSAILDDNELAIVGEVNNKMKERGFSAEIEKYTLYTISLFIYNNYIKNKSQKADEISSETDVKADDDSYKSNNLEEYAEVLDNNMSDNVDTPQEFHDESTLFSEDEYAYERGGSDEAFEEDKVERLKRIARESRLGGKTGVMVRRFES